MHHYSELDVGFIHTHQDARAVGNTTPNSVEDALRHYELRDCLGERAHSQGDAHDQQANYRHPPSPARKETARADYQGRRQVHDPHRTRADDRDVGRPREGLVAAVIVLKDAEGKGEACERFVSGLL